MARPPKGKPLTFRPIRLDDDVWAECQRLGKEHGTINEGLRAQILKPSPARVNISELSGVPSYVMCSECGRARGHAISCKVGNAKAAARQAYKRGPRPKGDKTR